MTRLVCCVEESELHHEGNSILARGVTWLDLHYREISLAGRGEVNLSYMRVARASLVAAEMERIN